MSPSHPISRPERSGPVTGPSQRAERATRAEPGAAAERPLTRAGARPRMLLARTGLAEPVVLVLLLIAFFSVISGKPLDGLFMLVVAGALAWDAGTRFRAGRQARDGTAAERPDSPTSGWGDTAISGPGARLRALQVLACGALYAVVVGSFSRYSWPTTVAVIGLAAVVLAIGWRGPLRSRRIPPKPGRLGLMLWGAVLVTGGFWELATLLEQPNIEVSSAAHPTISTLTDPLLGSAAGRVVVLAVWLVLGCFLVLR